MSDRPTPETNAFYWCIRSQKESLAFARNLERQRDAYAETIREFLDVATDFSESRRGYLRFLALADEIDERHPELAENAIVESRRK